MFALGICYLNGWAMAAADGTRKERAEWPPHPDRVFSALAAAWFETGEDEEEGETLRWLESLPSPSLSCTDATERESVVSYVPVNDVRTRKVATPPTDLEKLKKAGLTLVPEFRTRQPRGFPVAVPQDPTVYLLWPDEEVGERREGLDRLAAKVTHVGHSASLTQLWVETKRDISPTLVPDDAGVVRLRVPAAGRLEALKRAHNRDEVLEYADLQAKRDSLKGKARKEVDSVIRERFGSRAPVSQRPRPSRWESYSPPDQVEKTEAQGTVFGPRLTVLSIKGRRVSSRATLRLTQALRNALMSSCPEQPPPEWVSGHQPDGTRSTRPHLAFLPLPFVGSQHADGRIMGLALAFPRDLDGREVGRCLEPFLFSPDTGMPLERRLFGNGFPDCAVEIETRVSPPVNLVTDTWVRESRVWATVTPVVLNRHYDGRDKWARSAKGVADACEHVGLPRPREVILHPVSLVEGVPHAREFPPLERKDGSKRNHSHAVITFDEPVRGPVMVGAGRFRGYGLFRPMSAEKGNAGE